MPGVNRAGVMLPQNCDCGRVVLPDGVEQILRLVFERTEVRTDRKVTVGYGGPPCLCCPWTATSALENLRLDIDGECWKTTARRDYTPSSESLPGWW